MAPLQYPSGPPAGFPNCGSCAYMAAGPTWVCQRCVSAAVTPVAHDACAVCSQVTAGGYCSNALCRDPRRAIKNIGAIALYDGDLRRALHRYKYERKTGWATIFGRLLVGWLDENETAESVDMITMVPSWTGAGAKRDWHHIELIIDKAAEADVHGDWNLDAGAPRWLTVAGPTPQSAGSGRSAKEGSALELQKLLRLNTEVAGQRIVVFDDICTTGYSLDAVARHLKAEGAAEVAGVVIARVPWSG